MAFIYVREQGAVVRKRGGRLVAEKDHVVLEEILLRDTESVAIFGAVQVTTQALAELLRRGVPLAIYSRNGRYRGRLVPADSKDANARLAQYARAADPTRALEIARGIVAAKLHNSAALVAAYAAHYPEKLLRDTSRALRDAADRAASCGQAGDLLGLEGAGAAEYWRAFAAMHRGETPFPGRRRRPPPDPLNALLSLGYSLALGELRSLADAAGLEPRLGFLHRPAPRRPSLALDLLEAFRAPLVDRLALRLLNLRVLGPEDFALDIRPGRKQGVTLLPDSFRRFIEEWEEALSAPRAAAPAGMRAAMRGDVERLARCLRDNTPFEPYKEGECSI